LIYCREDRKICEALLRAARRGGDDAKPLSGLIVSAGCRFVGTPYDVGTLEREGPEELVINLRAFDCVTFIEAAIGLALSVRARKTDFSDYAAVLERLRYRRGRCEGYASRLHYFTDWLSDNGRKGMVRDVTGEIGGVPFRKEFYALTARREEHPPLKDATAFRRMRLVEAACSRRTLYRIPKDDLKRHGKKIADGDIVGIAADTEGIDVSHAGIAVRGRRGLHLLHASSEAGRVVLSDVTLYRYLTARRSRIGVIVGRAISPS
jgi:hypothetical protein